MKIIILFACIFLGLNNLLAAETILYIGDSHSYGKLGTVIDKNLSKNANHVIMEASCGASASTWLGNSGFVKTVCGFWKKDGNEEIRSVKHLMPKFSEELSKYHPDVVVIELGTNMASSEKPLRSKSSIEQMMKEIKDTGATCIWIGPPDANSKIVTKEKLKIVNDLIKDLSDKNDCHFIDSLKMTKFPKDSKEGIHYPPKLSAEWGEKISAEILKILP